MTKQEYADCQASVQSFLDRNHIQPGCHSPAKQDVEPFFSWKPCECCGSRLGGNRETYQFAELAGQVFTADICTDCVYFLAYGQLDDMTMIDMENAS